MRQQILRSCDNLSPRMITSKLINNGDDRKLGTQELLPDEKREVSDKQQSLHDIAFD